MFRPFAILTLASLGLATLAAPFAHAESTPGVPPRVAPQAGLGTPMTAEEFDAYVTGKTLTYSQFGQAFGVEQYLPDRRVAWRPTGQDCQYGKWFQKGDLICFSYDYSSAEHCWTFWTDQTGLRALSVDSLPGEELSEVSQTADGLNCPGPDVGV